MAANDSLVRFREVLEGIFNRWTALKLCVEHGMGGRDGHKTAIEIMNYTYDFCTQNEKCSEYDVQELLEDVMDQEFETVCDDNSIKEIAASLVRYLQLCREQKYAEIAAEIAKLPICNVWLTSEFKVQYAPKDDSSSDDDDDEDDEMDDAPMASSNTKSKPPKESASNSMDTEEDDGWTTVPSRRRH